MQMYEEYKPSLLETVASAPSAAPTSTKGAGGSLADGAYTYKVSFVDEDGGETLPSAATTSRTTETTNNTVALTVIPTGASQPGIVGRRIYRAVNAGTYSLIKELDDVTTTSWSDDGTETLDTDTHPLTVATAKRNSGSLPFGVYMYKEIVGFNNIGVVVAANMNGATTDIDVKVYRADQTDIDAIFAGTYTPDSDDQLPFDYLEILPCEPVKTDMVIGSDNYPDPTTLNIDESGDLSKVYLLELSANHIGNHVYAKDYTDSDLNTKIKDIKYIIVSSTAGASAINGTMILTGR